MSERGSFVTEFIYCRHCFEMAKSVLLSKDKWLCSTVLPSWEDGEFQIIAGKIGGLYRGEEIHSFEFGFVPKLAALICHPLRIAVLAEAGEWIFNVLPNPSRDG